MLICMLNYPHQFVYAQEFGSDDTPLHESEYTMPTIATYKGRKRRRRSLQQTTTVTVVLDKHTLDQIVFAINKTGM